MNSMDERTLAYLRGEKDLLEERLAEINKWLENLNLSYWMTGMSKRRAERFRQVVSLLHDNSRMSLTEMSRKLKIPVSTLFDTLKEIEKVFRFTIVLREHESRVLLQDFVPVEFADGGSVDTGEENSPHL